ncbi:hypothetical protein C8J56DRAFT_892433 [Mycena floridula]|nr:hypothetical protein C8J56DRAFT_892433 [Mycena floridula]
MADDLIGLSIDCPALPDDSDSEDSRDFSSELLNASHSLVKLSMTSLMVAPSILSHKKLVFLESSLWWHSAFDLTAFSWASGQVCCFWRQLALSLPQMWNTLNVKISSVNTVVYFYRDPDSDDDDDHYVIMCGWDCTWANVSKYSVAIIQEHIHRSQESLLSILICYSIRSSAVLDADFLAEVEELFSIIGNHSEQWKTACLSINDASLTRDLFNQINGCLSHLEKLEWGHLTPLGNVLVAPKLCNVVVCGPDLVPVLPWAQVTELNWEQGIYGMTFTGYLSTLQRAEKLERLTFFHCLWKPVQHTLSFNHLHVLVCGISALDMFLELPALTVLELTIGDRFSAL